MLLVIMRLVFHNVRLVFGGRGLWSLPLIVSCVLLSYNQTKGDHI
jgi:hypothetical protein|nr:MAG TPA: hypothetical protein [Caudoviricetes sp.]